MSHKNSKKFKISQIVHFLNFNLYSLNKNKIKRLNYSKFLVCLTVFIHITNKLPFVCYQDKIEEEKYVDVHLNQFFPIYNF